MYQEILFYYLNPMKSSLISQLDALDFTLFKAVFDAFLKFDTPWALFALCGVLLILGLVAQMRAQSFRSFSLILLGAFLGAVGFALLMEKNELPPALLLPMQEAVGKLTNHSLDPQTTIIVIFAGVWAFLVSAGLWFRFLVLRFEGFFPARFNRWFASTLQEKWLLAISAVYVEMNLSSTESDPQDFYALDMGFNSKRAKAEFRHVLQRDWNVTDEKSLGESLQWLLEGGHRREFHHYAVGLQRVSAEEIRSWQTVRNKVQREYLSKIVVVHKYVNKLGKVGISGWDFVRYGYLVRMGYISGYIDEKEALQLLERIAPLVKEHISSWKELVESWLAGYEYWGGDPEDRKKLCHTLLIHPKSPYREIPFSSF